MRAVDGALGRGRVLAGEEAGPNPDFLEAAPAHVDEDGAGSGECGDGLGADRLREVDELRILDGEAAGQVRASRWRSTSRGGCVGLRRWIGRRRHGQGYRRRDSAWMRLELLNQSPLSLDSSNLSLEKTEARSLVRRALGVPPRTCPQRRACQGLGCPTLLAGCCVKGPRCAPGPRGCLAPRAAYRGACRTGRAPSLRGCLAPRVSREPG